MTVEHAKTLAELRAIRDLLVQAHMEAVRLKRRTMQTDMPPGLFTLRRHLDNTLDACHKAIALQSG